MEKIDKYFFQEGLYWGKDYYIEESRHWEISEQKAQEWLKDGLFFEEKKNIEFFDFFLCLFRLY